MTKNQLKSPIKRERVRAIADMMAAGVYVTRDTPRVLAEKWGLSAKTVEKYACESANLLRLSIGDNEQIRTEMMGQLKRIQSLAFKNGTAVYPEGHARAGELVERNAYQWFNTAIQAMDRLAGLTGINAPKKSEVKHEYSLEDLSAIENAVKANECKEPKQSDESASSAQPSGPSLPSAGSARSFQRTSDDAN